jgi:hypothetical protein
MADREGFGESVSSFEYFRLKAEKQNGDRLQANYMESLESSGRKLISCSTFFCDNLDSLNTGVLTSSHALDVQAILLLQTDRNLHGVWTIL